MNSQRYQVVRKGQAAVINDTWAYDDKAQAVRSFDQLVMDFSNELHARFYTSVELVDTVTGDTVNSFQNVITERYVAGA